MHGIRGLTPVWLILAATASLILVYALKRGQWKKRKGNGQEARRVRGAVNEHTSEEPEAQQSGKGSEGFEEVNTNGQNRLDEVIQEPQPSQGEKDPQETNQNCNQGKSRWAYLRPCPMLLRTFLPKSAWAEKRKNPTPVAAQSEPGVEPKVVEPIDRGGKPRGATIPLKKPPLREAKVVPLKPEIVCWNSEWQWTAAVEVPEELLGTSGLMVLQNGSSLAQDGSRDNCWPLNQMSGQVLVQWNEHPVPRDSWRRKLSPI